MATQDYQRGGSQRKSSSPGNVKVELAAASVPHPAVAHRPGQAETAGWSRAGGAAPEQASLPLQQGGSALPGGQEENKGQPAYTGAQLEAARFQSGAAPATQQQEQLQQQ